MIYQYALPLALPRYRNVRIGGEVVKQTAARPRKAAEPYAQMTANFSIGISSEPSEWLDVRTGTAIQAVADDEMPPSSIKR